MTRTPLNLALGLAALLALGSADPAAADDATARQLFERAKREWTERADPARTDALIATLTEAEAQVQDTGLKYDILVLLSRALYWKGSSIAKTDKARAEIHGMGKDKADVARKLVDDFAEAHYFFAINIGRWAEANGILQSIKHKPKLVEAIEWTAQRNTRDGRPGNTYDGYGVDRVFGRMYTLLPSALGGSSDKALKHLKSAYENGKEVALNTVYYAEVLSKRDAAGKAEAKRILDDLLRNDPQKYNQDRVPETLDEFRMARKLRTELGN